MEKSGLDLLRAPFEAHHISKLPKPSKIQTDAVKQNYNAGIRCQVCGGWHHKDVVHLDYVGHAAITHRLLDCDPSWSWEPVSFSDDGLPKMDKNGGLWIRLTVCGVSRLGYGHPDGKSGGDAVKEAIGDALRNAAMRFGAALDLWHKGDLYAGDSDSDCTDAQQNKDSSEYTAFEAEHLQAMREAAMDGTAALSAAFVALPASPIKTQFWSRHGASLKLAAEKATVIEGGAE